MEEPNGADIAPDLGDPGEYMLRCRVHLTDDGREGITVREWTAESLLAS